MRKVTPLTIQVLLMLYCGTPVPAHPAQIEILRDFAVDGLTVTIYGATFGLTARGRAWAENVLACLPPRGYGRAAKGYYLIGSTDASFDSIEAARAQAILYMSYPSRPYYENGAFVLKAVELIEPAKPVFQTTYLL